MMVALWFFVAGLCVGALGVRAARNRGPTDAPRAALPLNLETAAAVHEGMARRMPEPAAEEHRRHAEWLGELSRRRAEDAHGQGFSVQDQQVTLEQLQEAVDTMKAVGIACPYYEVTCSPWGVDRIVGLQRTVTVGGEAMHMLPLPSGDLVKLRLVVPEA